LLTSTVAAGHVVVLVTCFPVVLAVLACALRSSRSPADLLEDLLDVLLEGPSRARNSSSNASCSVRPLARRLGFLVLLRWAL